MKKPWTFTAIGLGLFYAVSAIFHFKYLSYLPKCPFHQLTGYHCPGCGGTRAMKAIARGDLRSAFHYNALLFSFSCIGLFLLAKFIFQEWKYGRVFVADIQNRTVIFIVAVTFIFSILRNLPSPFFSWLAP